MKLSDLINENTEDIDVFEELSNLHLEEAELIFEVFENDELNEAKFGTADAKKLAGAVDAKARLIKLLDRGFDTVQSGSPQHKVVLQRKAAAVAKINKLAAGDNASTLRKEVMALLKDVKKANIKNQTKQTRSNAAEFGKKAGEKKAAGQSNKDGIKKSIGIEKKAIAAAKTAIAIAKKNIEGLKEKLSGAKSDVKSASKSERKHAGDFRKATRQRKAQTGHNATRFKSKVRDMARGASAGAGKFKSDWKNKVKGMTGNRSTQNESSEDDE